LVHNDKWYLTVVWSASSSMGFVSELIRYGTPWSGGQHTTPYCT